MNVFVFLLKYLLFPKFRYKEEFLAIKSAMKYLKQKRLNFDIENKAKSLSSWTYLCMVSYDQAKKDLEKEWNKKNKHKKTPLKEFMKNQINQGLSGYLDRACVWCCC
jgi:hypothetical protein